MSVTREALVEKFLETFEEGGLWEGLEPEAYRVRHRAKWAEVFADAVRELEFAPDACRCVHPSHCPVHRGVS